MTPRNPVRYAFGCPCCVQDGRRRGRSRLVTKRPDSGLNEINLKSGGKWSGRRHTAGYRLGKTGESSAPPGELVIKGEHQQLNWLGYVTEDSRSLALINHDAAATVSVTFPSLPSSPATLIMSKDSESWHEETRSARTPLALTLPRGWLCAHRLAVLASLVRDRSRASGPCSHRR